MTGCDVTASKADVIVPVYGNPLAVERCLTSVLGSQDPAIGRIVVIDDASPDETTRALLDRYAAEDAIELLRLDRNGGYVRAVNYGMMQTARDVVLLNSDAEVHGNWLSRMLDCLHSAPDCATVTPLSNNATICSYPWMGAGSGLPEGCSLALMDDVCARNAMGRSAVIPTGVGFCMLIRRAALERVGLFDADTYGLGYGEENDFCQRAIADGWHHRACGDTYVYHSGGGSFGDRKDALATQAEARLAQRYPDYPRRVRDFILRDGLRDLRDTLDVARVCLGPKHAAVVMRERAAERDWILGWLAHLVRLEDERESSGAEKPGETEETANSRYARLRGWVGRLWKTTTGLNRAGR